MIYLNIIVIFINFSTVQNSNICNIFKKLIIFCILVSLFDNDESGLYMFKSNGYIYRSNKN